MRITCLLLVKENDITIRVAPEPVCGFLKCRSKNIPMPPTPTPPPPLSFVSAAGESTISEPVLGKGFYLFYTAVTQQAERVTRPPAALRGQRRLWQICEMGQLKDRQEAGQEEEPAIKINTSASLDLVL